MKRLLHLRLNPSWVAGVGAGFKALKTIKHSVLNLGLVANREDYALLDQLPINLGYKQGIGEQGVLCQDTFYDHARAKRFAQAADDVLRLIKISNVDLSLHKRATRKRQSCDERYKDFH